MQFEQNEILIQKLAEVSPELPNSIKEFNDAFLFKNEERDNNTATKSFLELIKYFQELNDRKDGDILNQIQSLEKGLACVSNSYESIITLKKEIEIKSVAVEEEKKNLSETLAKLENKKISGENAIKEKEEADKAISEAETAKINARKNVENIRKNELEQFKNVNKPSRNHFLILKLMFLIFNPEDKIPSDDIKKELPNIKNKCLNQSVEQIKQKLISRIDNISWITNEFLEKVQMYREYPYTDLNKMEQISRPCKSVIGYFQNLIKYKRLYDIAAPLKKKSQQVGKAEAASVQKNEELEKEFNESKTKLDKVLEEQNTLFKKLLVAEKFINALAFIKDRWKNDVEKLKSK